MARRIGYRIWAKGDRCVHDYELRQARKRLARAIAQECPPHVIEAARECEAEAAEAVTRWEVRYQLGPVAR